MKREIAPEVLREHISYDPSSGEFAWRAGGRGNQYRPRAGGPVRGHICKDGYLMLAIFGKNFYAHRMAWAYVTGSWPEHLIDHINGVRLDNSFANLRQATNAENLWNRPKQKNNTSGLKGVSFHKASGLWMVRVKANGKIHNEYAKTLEEARVKHAAMVELAHGEFARVS